MLKDNETSFHCGDLHEPGLEGFDNRLGSGATRNVPLIFQRERNGGVGELLELRTKKKRPPHERNKKGKLTSSVSKS